MIVERYIEPENKHYVDQARGMVDEYSQHLASQIKKWLYRRGPNIEPTIDDCAEASRMFYEDPTRKYLINHFANIQSCFEKIIIKIDSNQN